MIPAIIEILRAIPKGMSEQLKNTLRLQDVMVSDFLQMELLDTART